LHFHFLTTAARPSDRGAAESDLLRWQRRWCGRPVMS
jgi:hypothetical protein